MRPIVRLQMKASRPTTLSSPNNNIQKLIQRAILPAAVVATGLLGLQSSAMASVIDVIQAKASSSGFVQAFLLIFVSEIGDKTFFIAGSTLHSYRLTR